MVEASRIELFKSELERLIEEGRDTDSVVFEAGSPVASRLQFMLHSGGVYGQLSWMRNGLSLAPSREYFAHSDLEALGFKPMPDGRFALAGLECDSILLAKVADQVFQAMSVVDAEVMPTARLLLGGEQFEGWTPIPRIGQDVLGMAVDYFRQRDLRVFYDTDAVMVDRKYEPSLGTALRILIEARGDRVGQLGVRVFSDQRFDRSERARAIDVCNRWNAERKYPKVYLETSPDPDLPASIVCEHFVELTPGITREMVEAWLDSAILNAFAFWEWVHSGRRLPAVTGFFDS